MICSLHLCGSSMAWGPHEMKFEVGTVGEGVMNGVSESDRCRLGRMRFWVEDDLDGSRVVGVHEDEIDSRVLLDVSVDVFCRLG